MAFRHKLVRWNKPAAIGCLICGVISFAITSACGDTSGMIASGIVGIAGSGLYGLQYSAWTSWADKQDRAAQ